MSAVLCASNWNCCHEKSVRCWLTLVIVRQSTLMFCGGVWNILTFLTHHWQKHIPKVFLITQYAWFVTFFVFCCLLQLFQYQEKLSHVWEHFKNALEETCSAFAFTFLQTLRVTVFVSFNCHQLELSVHLTNILLVVVCSGFSSSNLFSWLCAVGGAGGVSQRLLLKTFSDSFLTV